jgi:uncharacterized membrane protein
MMAGNVLFNIIPAHRELVAAKKARREPDPVPGVQAKQRSVHNNYLTLPVVFTMISTHFPFTYGHEHGWVVLLALMAIGAWVRHFFNLRHGGRTVWAIPATAAVAAAAVALWIEPDGGGAEARAVDDAPVAFADVQRIVERRCAACHSADPTLVAAPPQGITFDTTDEIAAQAEAIEAQAVRTNAMPPGNATGMTEEERETLAAWLQQGADLRK